MRGGLFRLALADRHLLRPGRYTLVAEKAGYRTLEHPFEIGEEAIQAFSWTLDRLPGRWSLGR